MEKALFWHQGLFLQPQHLQLLTRYSESLCQPFKDYLQPYFWGVGNWKIEQGSLANGSFKLADGEFVFRDMTHAVVQKNALVPARSFEGAWEKGEEGFGVYIGVRKFDPYARNVTIVNDLDDIPDVQTRWVTPSAAEEIADMHNDGPEAGVQKLYYVLKILWESEKENLGNYDLIPLTWLERDQDTVRISEGYVPPSLSINADPALFGIVKEIRNQIGARARQLEAYKRDRGLHSAEFGARDMVYLLALRSLNRYAPVLTHLTEAKHGHPWQVYGFIRQLIGELSTFAADISYNGEDREGNFTLPDYDHNEIGPCFFSAKALVTRLLDQITAGPEYVIPMPFDGTYYAAELPPPIFEGGNRVFMVLETESDPAQIMPSLESIAKLGCRESLPILIARSLSGLNLTHLPTTPQELPRRANALYFQVDRHSDQWTQIQKHKNIGLYWDSAPQDLKIELMVAGRS
ncbi:MAG: type VI secretion system baseplate subunit TssK [Desulfobacteraceae bacterium]|nr:type VI secretion system baseplate subunit TssK [Desulfobacteraceae bacterium]